MMVKSAINAPTPVIVVVTASLSKFPRAIIRQISAVIKDDSMYIMT